MSRDLTPWEQLVLEKYNIEHGLGSIWDFFERVVLNFNDKTTRLYSDEELIYRKQFPVLGKLITNTGDYSFSSLYEKLLKIEGGIELLHSMDRELKEYIESSKGDKESVLIKWFSGKLDPNFYYSEHNDELFGERLVEEALVRSSKNKFVVLPLNEYFVENVKTLDDMSGNCVSQWVEGNEDYAWGLFKDQRLVGYCTIGYADDCGSDVENYEGWNHNSLLLSDVYIIPEYRRQGGAQFMVNEVVKMRTENEKELVFLILLDDDLRHLYEKCGFKFVKEGLMVRDERVKTLDNIVSDAMKRSEEINIEDFKNNEFVKE